MSMYNEQITTQPAPPRIEMELQVMARELGELEATLDGMEKRIIPVSKRTNISTDAGKISENARSLDNCSPLAESLIVSNDRIKIVIKRLEEMIARIEL